MIAGEEDKLIFWVYRLLGYFKVLIEIRLIQKAYRGSFAFFYDERPHTPETRFSDVYPLFLPVSDVVYCPSPKLQASLPVQRHLAWMCFDPCGLISFTQKEGER